MKKKYIKIVFVIILICINKSMYAQNDNFCATGSSEELPFYFGQNEILDSILKITNKNLK